MTPAKAILVLIMALISVLRVQAAEIRMAVTTSFNNSSLSDVLLPAIKKDLDLDVHLLIVGTGQALKLGKSGDVDAILVHSKTAEEAFVAEGYAIHRTEIMYNDFVLIGPKEDPAGIISSKSALEALQKVKAAPVPFISRGDDSGTNKKEKSLWQKAGLNSSTFNSDWYKAVGSGMGAALNIASGMNAYIMADRASWLNFSNKRNLEILFEGDPELFNQYAYLPINPKIHPHVKFKLAMKLEDWLVSNKAQTIIGNFEINNQQLFTPNANKTAQ